MCSRYKLHSKPFDLKNRFNLKREPIIDFKAEQYPSDPSLVIDFSGPKHSIWGLKVDWASGLIINARAETLTYKKTFTHLLMNRCLVPANCYYEWARTRNGKKSKYCVKASDQKTMAFAGLIDNISNRLAIITCASPTSIAHLHPRMPVILDPSIENGWLDYRTEIKSALSFLRSYTKVELIKQSAI